MKHMLCLLLSIIMLFSSSTVVLAVEDEEYITVSAEYSDNVGNSEKLDLMLRDENVYVNAEMLASRLGYQFTSSDEYITILNKDNSNLPLRVTQFYFNSTKVNHMLFTQMNDTYEAPFVSIKNDKGCWIPLEYSLLILNSGLLLLDNSILIDIPNKNILDYYYDIMKNSSDYNFEWNKDFGYTETDWKIIGASSHIVNMFSGILNFDGDSWASMFQAFAMDSSAYDKKYGENLALLLCSESEGELNASIEKMKLYQNIFSDEGQLGKILTTYKIKSDTEVDTLYNNCQAILKGVEGGNSSVANYNETYQALEQAFDKQTWFSNTGENIIEVQKGLSDATSVLDIGLRIAEVVGYGNEFTNQDKFSQTALSNYLDNTTSSTTLSSSMKQSMRDYSDILSSNLVEYSATRFLNENVDGWIAEGLPLEKALGTQGNVALFAWNLASNMVPFISNGLDAADKFELTLYAQVFQSDVFLNYLSLRDETFRETNSLSPEKLYNLSKYCYVYLKSCYTARNSALASLAGKFDSAKEQIQPLIDKQNGINSNIANMMVDLKSANDTNEGNVYGFLPSDNKKYLDKFNNSGLMDWIVNSKSNGTNIFEQLPQGFDFSAGAGAWATHFDLNADGTFTGQYHDSERGATGSGFSNGTVYICNFTGKFTTPKQIDEYTYSMKLDYLNTEGTPDEEYYEDNTRYIFSEPYGFDDAEEFLIYLPGINMSDLPDGFKSWLNAFLDVQTTDVFPYYGIYNVSGQAGFVAQDEGMSEEEVYNKLVAHYKNGTEDAEGSDLIVMEGNASGSVYSTIVRCGVPGNASASQPLYDVQVDMRGGKVIQTRILTDNKKVEFNIKN